MTASEQQRILILGNSGSGKTTLSRGLAQRLEAEVLSLDLLAWLPSKPPERRPLAESAAAMRSFCAGKPTVIIEGCYGDLAEVLLPEVDLFVLLDPGLEACLAHARSRPHEPDKYASAAEQDANLPMLLGWIADYEQRDDALSRPFHERLFANFEGPRLRLGSQDRTAQVEAVLERVEPGR